MNKDGMKKYNNMNILINSNSEMRSINSARGMAKLTRSLIVLSLMLFCFTGRVMAQSDPAWIIKSGAYYMAHVNDNGTWKIQATTTLGPECIWYSGRYINNRGATHNYYFNDGTSMRFIKAVMDANQEVTLSPANSEPTITELTEGDYYFANWDWGLSRGVQTGSMSLGTMDGCLDRDISEDGQECWTVYWVEYNNTTGKWQTSGDHQYNPTSQAAVFRRVRVNEHDIAISNETNPLGNIVLTNTTMAYGDNQTLSISANAYSYNSTPAYTTYLVGELDNCGSNWATRSCDTDWVVHNYFLDADHLAQTPTPETISGVTASSYSWSVSGDGASYLSFNNSTSATPVLTYSGENRSGDKTATITVTVTYSNGATRTRSAEVTLTSLCGHPLQAAAPVVSYEDVTVSWVSTNATSYSVSWKKDENAAPWSTPAVTTETSYTITGLDYNTDYIYKVEATCASPDPNSPAEYPFTTGVEPGLLVYGSVFGGGRMADVDGKTEVVIINCEEIGAVYGGNDIAGEVLGNSGADGSTITLGVKTSDTYATEYNSGNATVKVKVGSVYGGGNGYYIYGNASEFEGATSGTATFSGDVKSMEQAGHPVVVSGLAANTKIPTIVKTKIVTRHDNVVVDSIFGGAKNAFVTKTTDTNTSITIDGGVIYSVFGGNNYGGTLGNAYQHVVVQNTKNDFTALGLKNTSATGFGRDFGVRYLFGGGNKVAGQKSHIQILGGQTDTVFGGGNSADVANVWVDVNCSFTGGTSVESNNWALYGNTITKAVSSYESSGDELTIDNTYAWNCKGLYNARAVFGGNNEEDMTNVPTINLLGGSVGTVYGGGNSGKMLAQETDNGSGSDLVLNGNDVKYGTHVVMNANKIFVDGLYGGCQKSDVLYSTWVEVKNGYAGYVYGGCNISGDVGSVRLNQSDALAPGQEDYQAVRGGTYVVVTGGKVYKNVYAGSNGFYHCNNGVEYVNGIDYDDIEHYYIGEKVPTHNETNVIVEGGAMILGNVYAGGNMAAVGFDENWSGNTQHYPLTVGLASVHINNGTVAGNVFGGGNMASIYGKNEVVVTGGIIGGSLYGGNDRLGMTGLYPYRVLPSIYSVASDTHTPLADIDTYISVTGKPKISTIYGGGNGDYDYSGNGDMQYCNNLLPIQKNTFVDIGIDGDGVGDAAAEIGTVYGGGDGVTVDGIVKVFVNVQNPDYTNLNKNDISTIFGGNNKGDLDLVPEIILLHGKVGTVYGGCNQGAMTGHVTKGSYSDVGSYVHLIDEYVVTDINSVEQTTQSDAVVTGAVYGGCRMNDVDYNSLVVIDGGTHSNAAIYGGCDISGNVGLSHNGKSQVVMNGGAVGIVYGGGNGNYTYDRSNYSVYDENNNVIATGTFYAPKSKDAQVDILGGVVGSTSGSCVAANVVFGGGYGEETETTGSTIVNIGPEKYMSGQTLTDATGVSVADGESTADVGPEIYGSVYGGSALGEVNSTTVNIRNGYVCSSVYGGGLGDTTYALVGGSSNIAAKVNGNAVVNIGTSNQNSNNVVIGEYVFGGNNNNGSPAGTVNVNIYRTGHTQANTVPVSTPGLTLEGMASTWPGHDPNEEDGSLSSYYALKGVYGGGNLAHKSSTGLTTVHVYNCDNSIKYVYGGGKAADLGRTNPSTGAVTITASSALVIDGGHVFQVFGGGDGAATHDLGGGNSQLAYANITGNTSATINGGYMHYVFGGSNTRGTIHGTKSVTVADEGSCVDPVIYNFFAGGNLAESSGNIETTINNCNVKFGNFYGGANQAAIHGNVTTNIYGGTYINIFGGSKSADITSYNTSAGDVTVNFHGGTVTNIFGGNDHSGQISGNIVVNVEADGSCGFSIDNVYGGGRDAAYGCAVCGTAGAAVNHGNYPQVNIKHTGTYDASTSTTQYLVNYDVFGGGLGTTAHVYGNPHVNIGDGASGHTVRVGRNVFGGGSLAPVTGSTAVKVVGKNTTTVVNNVYGGGNQATVTGNTDVQIGD